MSRLPRVTLVVVGAFVAALGMLASGTRAAERELDTDSAPRSTSEIETPIERVFPVDAPRPPLIPWFRQHLQGLPPFFADTQLEARFRTYYLRKDRASDILSEAWAVGGSIAYRSGWLEDVFQLEVEGFTSQPVVAQNSRDGTLLLEPGQDGYSVLGIANAKLRYRGLVLTGFRQYLDLPYVNRQDNRMTPNTFESITLEKPEGDLRFSAGYTWRIKTRNSDEFESMTEAVGADKDRGLIHGGAVWDRDGLHVGGFAAGVPDLFGGLYGELGVSRDLSNGVGIRLDGQFTHQWDHGDDLLGDALDDAWNLGLRGSVSRSGIVLRLGTSITGSNSSVVAFYGTNPSYVDLMQSSFNRADEKALLASASYGFERFGLTRWTAILNFVAGFDGKLGDDRRKRQELDFTLDYKIDEGWLDSFWFRVRGSWLHEEGARQDGTDVRIILRYDFPVI